MYQFQFECDFQELLTLNRVHEKVHRSWWRSLIRGLSVVVGVIALLETGLLVALGTETPFLCALLVVMGLILLSGGFWRPRLSAWQSKRMQVKHAGESTVTLDEEGAHGCNLKGNNFSPWASFEEAYYSRECYLLFVDRTHALVLPVRALTQGDPAALRAFLEEKLQKEIIDVR